MKVFTSQQAVAFHMALHLPIPLLVKFRCVQFFGSIIRDNCFWRRRLEVITGKEVPERFVLPSCYSVCKYIEESKPEELLYSDDANEVRYVLYLNKFGVVNIDPSKSYRQIRSCSFPLDRATYFDNEPVVRALLEDPRTNPFASHWAIFNSVDDKQSSPINILQMLLSTNHEDPSDWCIRIGFQGIVQQQHSLEKALLFLNDTRFNPNDIAVFTLVKYEHIIDIMAIYLENSKLDRHIIRELFKYSVLLGNIPLAEIVLQNDKKAGQRFINKELCYDLLKYESGLIHEKLVVYLLEKFREYNFFLDVDECNLLIANVNTSEPEREEQAENIRRILCEYRDQI